MIKNYLSFSPHHSLSLFITIPYHTLLVSIYLNRSIPPSNQNGSSNHPLLFSASFILYNLINWLAERDPLIVVDSGLQLFLSYPILSLSYTIPFYPVSLLTSQHLQDPTLPRVRLVVRLGWDWAETETGLGWAELGLWWKQKSKTQPR